MMNSPKSMFGIRRILKGAKALIFGPRSLRRRAFREIARVTAEMLGVAHIGDDYKLWVLDTEFADKFKSLSPHNYFSMERKFALREFARSVERLPGVIAECGTYVGVSTWFIAKELSGTDFYLFDSFEGLSPPSVKDRANEWLPQWHSGDMAASELEARNNLHEFSNLHFMKGWIPERFEEISYLRFKFLHIDVDLYQPTWDSLAFFYERMVPGGIIVMDDYGYENCPGAYLAANEFMSDRPESIIHLPTGQGIIIVLGGSDFNAAKDVGFTSGMAPEAKR